MNERVTHNVITIPNYQRRPSFYTNSNRIRETTCCWDWKLCQVFSPRPINSWANIRVRIYAFIKALIGIKANISSNRESFQARLVYISVFCCFVEKVYLQSSRRSRQWRRRWWRQAQRSSWQRSRRERRRRRRGLSRCREPSSPELRGIAPTMSRRVRLFASCGWTLCTYLSSASFAAYVAGICYRFFRDRKRDLEFNCTLGFVIWEYVQ